MDSNLILNALFFGAGATAVMDFAALIQRCLLSVPSLDYALVGRWLGHVVRRRFIHRPITASPPVRGERLIGWSAHYLTGILFAIVFLAAAGRDWINDPSLWPSLAFGILTLIAPFLILQPGMGTGLAARRAPARTWPG